MRTVDPEQHARKRALILQAAAREFAVHGVDGTSTASVCRRAGIGSGTLFHYFPTKRALFHALFSDDLPRNAAARERALAAARPGDGLDLLVDHLLTDLADPLVPGLLAAALFQANRDEEFAVMVATDEALTRDALTTLLERAAADGCRPAFPPERLAGWILRLSDACYLAAGEEGFDPVAQTAELRRIVAGLVGRPAG
ncbi:TetR/AcrR family transcriptional regulator [Streptomyces albireticuli]|uniref:TetR family transcriptional regulator n=1 Tax=Streptomyces albireticuli TaxID=1940 RepID=A0A2A2CVW2_9ACTN|nr:TetR/AcrR family transcriptional regulator [Streptomyces albireticuli]MCD9143868.1 TetR/AcrR family transcriptional regulator [Streptomyces albireticuli]MCD9161701.1 TetR/AcrR family transcriptional regulator [Streptomyces albireticuli]MCD9191985.1 TetR/AcrR family transcriptional regulator [Streptomyces albireticuli]PAU44343.1 TetR family transcriptional regulator [Streptomyces albireticuli]